LFASLNASWQRVAALIEATSLDITQTLKGLVYHGGLALIHVSRQISVNVVEGAIGYAPIFQCVACENFLGLEMINCSCEHDEIFGGAFHHLISVYYL